MEGGHEEATEGLQRFPYLAQSCVQRTGFLVRVLFTTSPPGGTLKYCAFDEMVTDKLFPQLAASKVRQHGEGGET